MTAILNNIKKSFSEVRKEMAELKDNMSSIEKELANLTGKISLIENMVTRK